MRVGLICPYFASTQTFLDSSPLMRNSVATLPLQLSCAGGSELPPPSVSSLWSSPRRTAVSSNRSSTSACFFAMPLCPRHLVVSAANTSGGTFFPRHTFGSAAAPPSSAAITNKFRRERAGERAWGPFFGRTFEQLLSQITTSERLISPTYLVLLFSLRYPFV